MGAVHGVGPLESLRIPMAAGESMDGCEAWQDGELWFCFIRDGDSNEIDGWLAPCDGDLIFVHHYSTECPGLMLEADLYIARRR